MEFLNEKSNIPTGASIILGFFDGIHAGHQRVLENVLSDKKVVFTFKESPAKYFSKNYSSIYSRNYNYELMEKFGVDYIYEQSFEDIVNISASDYLDFIVSKFQPISITTGFNHAFGAKRQGSPVFLEKNQHNFKYLCTEPMKIKEEIVSSTLIKQFLQEGNIKKANRFLTRCFSLESTVIEGKKLGRKLGFPTANMEYPKEIVKIPYGVYKVRVFEKNAIMNWGIKPTFNEQELIEIYIPDFNQDLYGKKIRFEIIEKIKDEKKV